MTRAALPEKSVTPEMLPVPAKRRTGSRSPAWSGPGAWRACLLVSVTSGPRIAPDSSKSAFTEARKLLPVDRVKPGDVPTIVWYANGDPTPGIVAGFASERLMVAEPCVTEVMPSLVNVPLRFTPLSEPLAASSTVPVGDGDSVSFPTMLMSPENAVARSVPGESAATVENGPLLVSLSRSHGWNQPAAVDLSAKTS